MWWMVSMPLYSMFPPRIGRERAFQASLRWPSFAATSSTSILSEAMDVSEDLLSEASLFSSRSQKLVLTF